MLNTLQLYKIIVLGCLHAYIYVCVYTDTYTTCLLKAGLLFSMIDNLFDFILFCLPIQSKTSLKKSTVSEVSLVFCRDKP